MAVGSQKAQGLPHPVTSMQYIQQQGHVLILLVEERRCLGIHKVGLKHLFQYNQENKTHEMTAFCCLDFYVHESQQRKGLGLLMFEVAEKFSKINPKYWAFDKPSPKLFAFLQKHYGMNLKTNFGVQVSKYAMSEEAINTVGETCSKLLRDQKLGRIQFDKILSDPILMATNQMQLLLKYLPSKCLGQWDERDVITLANVTLQQYREAFQNYLMQKSIQVQKINLEQTSSGQTAYKSENVEEIVQSRNVRQSQQRTGFW